MNYYGRSRLGIRVPVLRCVTSIWFMAALAAAGQKRQSSPIWRPSDVPWVNNVPATARRKMITSLSVAGFPIHLTETSMEDAQRHLGGTAGSSGDASESLGWLCFSGRDAGGPWVLWLESFEVDGPTIGGFQWERVPEGARFDRRCHALPAGGTSVRLPLPLRLGMTDAEVREVLGNPSVGSRKTSFYLYEHDLTVNHVPYTADNSIAMMYQRGKLKAIAVIWSIIS
jgi:hypothetical protein